MLVVVLFRYCVMALLMESVTKTATGISFQCLVTQFFCNTKTTFVVFYCLFMIIKSPKGMAKTTTSFSFPSFVFQVYRNPERNVVVLDSFIESAHFLEIITKTSASICFLNLVLQISRNAKSKFVIFYGFLVFTSIPKNIAKTTIHASFISLIFDKFGKSKQFLMECNVVLEIIRQIHFPRVFCKFTFFCFAKAVFDWKVRR